VLQGGWGKELTYVLGFSVDGVHDVTPRYCKRMADLLPRLAPGMLQMELSSMVCSHVHACAGARRCRSGGWLALAQRSRSACDRTWTRLQGE
jgi:hypothetical protein